MSLMLSGTDLACRLPDGSHLFSGISLSIGRQRIGLIGENGVGKTHLLEVLAGFRVPAAGSVSGNAKVGVLSQAYDRPPALSDVLEVGAALRAHERVATGNGTPADFALAERDWGLPDRVQALRLRLGIAGIPLDRPAASLSGGELTRARIVALLLPEPDVLLLDEPTNHLDRDARDFIYDLIREWKGGMLVVSHDRTLLRLMDEIAEMSAQGLRLYGGNYDVYRERRNLEAAAAEQAVTTAEQQVSQARQMAHKATERQHKRTALAERNADKLGLPPIIRGALKRKAQVTAGTLADVHERRVQSAETALHEARQNVPEVHRITVDLGSPPVPAGKRMVEFTGVNVRFPSSPRDLWKTNLSFEVTGPERIALAGPNGSGKTSVVNLILQALTPSAGQVYLGTSRIGLLDQEVSILDPERTLLEHLQRVAPGRPEHDLRVLLGRFLFRGDTAFKPAGVLSGGERMRAGLVLLLGANQAPDILLLDEPTNNLDLSSQEAVISALQAYRGVLIVISHDAEFLQDIGITRTITVPERS